jgi:hypothetical protein
MSKEAQFYRLQQEVIDLKAKDEAFTKKLTELQVSQELKARKLSSVQVIQDATMPLGPVPPWTVLTLGLGIGAAPFLGMALVRAARTLGANSDEPDVASALDRLERDKQHAVPGLSHQYDFGEISTGSRAADVRRVAAQNRELAAGLDALASQKAT